MQAFEYLPAELKSEAGWHETLTLLDTKVDLHAYVIEYWPISKMSWMTRVGVLHRSCASLSRNISPVLTQPDYHPSFSSLLHSVHFFSIR